MSSSDEMEGLHDDLVVDQIDELMVHPWLQFPQGMVACSRRDRLLRKEMGQQKAIDYDLLAELGQLERMTAIIGEETPWSRLFEMTFAPQYRLITVEFLSTFVYRPRGPDYQPQAGAQPSEISFRLCGFAYELSLTEFGNALDLYTEQELTMMIYTTAIHTAHDAVINAWWPRISDEPFFRVDRVTRIRDPLIRYLHRVIATSITGRGMSQEWCTTYYHRQERWLIYGGVYVTRLARANGLISMVPAGMQAFASVRLDKQTVQGMRVVQMFPGVGFRFSLQKGVIWQPGPNDLHYRDEDPMPQPQQQPQIQPEQHAEQQYQQPPPQQPPPQDVPHQHPERVYRAVRLPARVEAMLQHLIEGQAQIQQQLEHSLRLARLEDLISLLAPPPPPPP
ncbi:hypothetical protein R6Q57_014313 [Mikania cordata]